MKQAFYNNKEHRIYSGSAKNWAYIHFIALLLIITDFTMVYNTIDTSIIILQFQVLLLSKIWTQVIAVPGS